MMKRATLAVLFLFLSLVGYSQLAMSAKIQTNHLWRGGEVADGIVVISDASVKLLDESLNIGVWGGINTQGTYKEFNYFASYSLGGFSVALWDTYNFAEYATYNNEEFFNYNASTTGRFLDATLSYQFCEKFPLKLSWSTVLFGRDRDSSNSGNRYSTFCYGEYPIYKKDLWRVDLGVGAAFALNPMGESAIFYGDKPGVVHIEMRVSRDLVLGKYTLPLSLTTVWNPLSDKAYLQLAAQIFSF